MGWAMAEEGVEEWFPSARETGSVAQKDADTTTSPRMSPAYVVVLAEQGPPLLRILRFHHLMNIHLDIAWAHLQ